MAKKTNVYYTYEGSGYFDEDKIELTDVFSIETIWDPVDDPEYIAEECADDYHSNHDGWESSWPLRLKLWNEKGERIGVFEVERDVEPVFSAYILE